MEVRRGASPAMLAALAGQVGHHLAVLIESEWPDGMAYAHSGVGPMDWDGQTWTGLGQVATAEMQGAGTSLVPREATLGLPGSFETLFPYQDDAARFGMVRIWLAVTTTPGGTTLAAEPALEFVGRIDGNDLAIDPAGEVRLSITASTGASARTTVDLTHSGEAQRRIDPTDTGFDRTAHAEKYNANPPQFPEP